jgi:signal transduction histidine kinase
VGNAVDAGRRWAHSVPTLVAVRSTAAVAAVYLVLSMVVVLIVGHNLTAGVDQHVANALKSMQQTGHAVDNTPSDGQPNFGDPLGRRYGAPLVVWVVNAQGEAAPYGRNAPFLPNLPVANRHVAGPDTISIGGTEVRVEGGPAALVSVNGSPLGDGWVVVGQSTAQVAQARDTIILTEAVIFPILLLLVFFGALAVGRRVAAPLERARLRQLEFTADASHELRTPLSVIEAEATLALSRPREADSYRASFVRVEVESKRLRRLVDDLLWLARFDAAPEPPDAELVDLGVLAGGAVERFRPVAERRSQRISGAVTGPAAPMITAPPDWLDRLLGVLLDNACRYSGDAGEVRVSVATDSNHVRLSVEDSGPGIPADQRAQVFDRFHRASSTPGGAGLGLAIGDAVVRATGGRWTVGDSPAGGASMTVIWPRATGERTARTGDERPAAQPPTPPAPWPAPVTDSKGSAS